MAAPVAHSADYTFTPSPMNNRTKVLHNSTIQDHRITTLLNYVPCGQPAYRPASFANDAHATFLPHTFSPICLTALDLDFVKDKVCDSSRHPFREIIITCSDETNQIFFVRYYWIIFVSSLGWAVSGLRRHQNT